MQSIQANEALITYDEMLNLLRQYRPMKKRAAELKSILENPPITQPAMKIGSSFSLASDLYDRFATMVEKTRNELKAEWQSLTYLTTQLEQLISLLDPPQRDVICALFIDGLTY